MILPIRTSINPRRTPYANYGLIAVTVLIFLITYHPKPVRVFGRLVGETTLRLWADKFVLTPNTAEEPDRFSYGQLVSYAFLHANWAHIIGNMFFLFIFGNNVNDKLGNFGYLCFYAAGAVFSGLGHMFFSGTSVLGASGAVAAVTGAYLVLFSKTEITVIYWFFFIGTFELPAYYFIGLKMILFDNMIADTDQRVAYDAHLTGYAFGIAASLFLLVRGLVRRENFDLLYVMTQWNRRRRYRDTVSDGYDPFSGRTGQSQSRTKRKKKTPAEHIEMEDIAKIRSEIAQLISQRNLPQAAKIYENLLDIDPDQVLPRQHQLDIANQLMSMGKWAMSAQAYERFLSHYRNYEHLEQVELMLGVLLCRYLEKPTKAVGLLKAAREKLTDPGQIKMCDDELKRLENSGS